MKTITITILLIISSKLTSYSQDTIVTKSNENIPSKVIEITPTEIKYKKIENIDGPTYSISKSEIIKIRYLNGIVDIFNKNWISKIKISRENPIELTKKGNNVFIEIPDDASRAGERYFIEALMEWGYWNILNDINQADFIIVFNIEKKAMLHKEAFVTFKTIENIEFKKSKNYRESTTIFNGYNAFKGVAYKIVDKYLKKEFK